MCCGNTNGGPVERGDGIPLVVPVGWLGRQRMSRLLAENDDLCVFVNAAILNGHVEFGLHGLCRALGGCKASHWAAVARGSRTLKALVESVVPCAELRALVPPWNDLSAAARDEALEQGFAVCANQAAGVPAAAVAGHMVCGARSSQARLQPRHPLADSLYRLSIRGRLRTGAKPGSGAGVRRGRHPPAGGNPEKGRCVPFEA